jgi:hypothetical protein
MQIIQKPIVIFATGFDTGEATTARGYYRALAAHGAVKHTKLQKAGFSL